jgi:hypothetical protein
MPGITRITGKSGQYAQNGLPHFSNWLATKDIMPTHDAQASRVRAARN